ncbi:5-methyltetrahydropteroyltriglutamate--homocysteine S-methyltransferase [Buchnera aphidicola]|uniref:5-methyltetrahydropteroyltriglutamate--homocysteine methyltransferase n=1 Tax=Buchnera aphidicola (Anoecia oenotherae) TaxID=1241833 RepID=A0A4D6XUI5_9GAMM|nr:5-methyltetrahydropteroyltriglutamate--homocysteine S-methyltransferase [Buchnera aphidicola]QCI19169.1 5-methyltetrahydropteroyltriglutamate--homocysteine S-methyltransferase [Buchnera aphidicola (Anoecia oenotherae)]
MTTIFTHTLGFPRIGTNRELKQAQEKYWSKKITKDELFSTGKKIRINNWKKQAELGIDLIPVGDFSWYDHVLNTTMLLGNIPERFKNKNNTIDIDTIFKIAKGYQSKDKHIVPSEMKKWFNTNYHYIVPEFTKNSSFTYSWKQLIEEVDEAIELGFNVKPVILGPISYLWLGKEKEENFHRLDLLAKILHVYKNIISKLEKRKINWIQIEEPILTLDLSEKWLNAFKFSYEFMKNSKKILLTTYFGSIFHNIETIKELPVQGLHIDITNKNYNIDLLCNNIPKKWLLSLGVINGRNVWKTNLNSTINTINLIKKIKKNICIGTSCSLIHVPIDLSVETKISKMEKSWLSFALEKCHELFLLKTALITNNYSLLKEWSKPVLSRTQLNKNIKKEKEEVILKIKKNNKYQKSPYSIRSLEQKKCLKLPILPITTIGSFPQTDSIRQLRLDFKLKNISSNDYETKIKENIKKIISFQESLNIDVLVHGEVERNDMVEYFGEQLNGFLITSNGWVQSYGSRCVKPPIIISDISRPKPMTVKWMKYAQSLTKKPIKGMLTGPVTILCWSFVRDDIKKSQVAYQLALALQDEVLDLEKIGINIIQIDEPALREGLPLRKKSWENYLNWATESFRLTYYKTKNKTQIHTHMCYCEFNDIIQAIIKLDVDVITLETSRSDIKLLKLFQQHNYINEIGPGFYDIHSSTIPTVKSIQSNLEIALKYISINRLWVNPDCGLKTRNWKEIKQSLENIVTATKNVRKKNKPIN